MLFLTLVFQCYLVVAFLVFAVFLQSFLQDKSTPNTHIGSWVMITFSIVFWPIIVPLAYLERQGKKSDKRLQYSRNLALETPHPSFQTNNVIPFPYGRLKSHSFNQSSPHSSPKIHKISSYKIQRKNRF